MKIETRYEVWAPNTPGARTTATRYPTLRAARAAAREYDTRKDLTYEDVMVVTTTTTTTRTGQRKRTVGKYAGPAR
jgi:hypothetical protein